jgi:hypothetical protein
MSDPTKHTAKSAERNLSGRFGSYLFALGVFFGAHLIYKAEGAAFDILAGFMASTLVASVMKISRQSIVGQATLMEQLKSYRRVDYKLSGLFNGRDLLFWAAPVLIAPYLLYKNDYPIQLLRFGISFIVGYAGLYIYEINRALEFYSRMDKYIDWGSLDADKEGIPN